MMLLPMWALESRSAVSLLGFEMQQNVSQKRSPRAQNASQKAHMIRTRSRVAITGIGVGPVTRPVISVEIG